MITVTKIIVHCVTAEPLAVVVVAIFVYVLVLVLDALSLN